MPSRMRERKPCAASVRFLLRSPVPLALADVRQTSRGRLQLTEMLRRAICMQTRERWILSPLCRTLEGRERWDLSSLCRRLEGRERWDLSSLCRRLVTETIGFIFSHGHGHGRLVNPSDVGNVGGVAVLGRGRPLRDRDRGRGRIGSADGSPRGFRRFDGFCRSSNCTDNRKALAEARALGLVGLPNVVPMAKRCHTFVVPMSSVSGHKFVGTCS